MRAGLAIILFIAATLAIITTASALQGIPQSGVVVLKNANGTQIGQATFTEDNNKVVHISVSASGLSPGIHGIHIHGNGNCTGPTFASAGDHYNPMGKQHGLNNTKGSHAGDLPNLVVGSDGRAQMDFTTDMVTLSPGPATLFPKNGTSLVIHSGPDDQMSNPAGNSGSRIACGPIVAK